MGGVTLELDEEWVEVLRLLDQPVERAARELMVMELYRRHEISRGKAASLLGMRLADFLDLAGSLGIPYVEYTEEEWAAEMRAVEETVRLHQSLLTRAR